MDPIRKEPRLKPIKKPAEGITKTLIPPLPPGKRGSPTNTNAKKINWLKKANLPPCLRPRILPDNITPNDCMVKGTGEKANGIAGIKLKMAIIATNKDVSIIIDNFIVNLLFIKVNNSLSCFFKNVNEKIWKRLSSSESGIGQLLEFYVSIGHEIMKGSD